MGADFMQAKCGTVFGDGWFLTRVYLSGIIEQRWQVEQVGSGDESIQTLLREGLPMHRAILEEQLGHRGDVAVALFKQVAGTQRRLRPKREASPGASARVGPWQY